MYTRTAYQVNSPSVMGIGDFSYPDIETNAAPRSAWAKSPSWFSEPKANVTVSVRSYDSSRIIGD